MTQQETETANELAGKYAEQYAKTADEVPALMRAFISGYEAKCSENESDNDNSNA